MISLASPSHPNMPSISDAGDLRIPHNSPPRFHWWRRGQSVAATITEIKAKGTYTPDPIRPPDNHPIVTLEEAMRPRKSTPVIEQKIRKKRFKDADARISENEPPPRNLFDQI